MKRSLLLLVGAVAMTTASCLTIATTTAAPAAAAPASANFVSPASLLVNIGYLISCVGGPLQALPSCLKTAVNRIIQGLQLPAFPTSNALTAPSQSTNPFESGGAQLPSSTMPPALNLPSSVAPILKSLPSALQTPPLQNAPVVVAPLRRLISAPAPRVAVPKAPTLVPINLFNAASSAPVETSTNPISASDLVLIIGLGAVGAAAGNRALRRRYSLR